MAPFMASSARGSRWVAPESGELWSGALPTATTNTTTNTSAFNDTQQKYRVVIFIPQNYTCHKHPAVGEYICVQMLDGANSHIRHSRAGRALLPSRKECGWLWVLLGSAVQAGPHTQSGMCIDSY